MRRDSVPTPTDLLCERCGYLLNGLPDDGHCPECGAPVAESTVASVRALPAWESGTDHAAGRFRATFLLALRRPWGFFRSMRAHGDAARARQFGRLSMLPAVVFGTKAVILHYAIMAIVSNARVWPDLLWVTAVTAPLVVGAWLSMYFAVIRLTTWESTYWGLRLPNDVVGRALNYLGPTVSLLSAVPWAIASIYLCLIIADLRYAVWLTTYLYVLSASVVVIAIYLFYAYAAAMKSLMYANR